MTRHSAAAAARSLVERLPSRSDGAETAALIMTRLGRADSMRARCTAVLLGDTVAISARRLEGARGRGRINRPKRGRPPLAQPSSDVVHHGARRSGEVEVPCAACRQATLMEPRTFASLRCGCAPRRVIRSECSCCGVRTFYAMRARDAYKNGARCGWNLTALDVSSTLLTHQSICSPALPSLLLLSSPLPSLAEVRLIFACLRTATYADERAVLDSVRAGA